MLHDARPERWLYVPSEAPAFRTSNPPREFTIISNHALRDDRLSLRAKGLLALMLSFPDDWTYYLHHLQGQSTDGRDGTRSACRELEALGYVRRIPRHEAHGRFAGINYVVTDTPTTFPDEDGPPDEEHVPDTADGLAVDGEAPATKTERSTKNYSHPKTLTPPTPPSDQPAPAKPSAVKSKAPPKFDPLTVDLPENVARESWTAFVKHRGEIRAKVTATTAHALLKTLAAAGADADAILDRSVQNGWRGIFPLPDDYHRTTTTQASGTPPADDPGWDMTPDEWLKPTGNLDPQLGKGRKR